jgi:hypothetical protein
MAAVTYRRDGGDAEVASDLMTASYPALPQDPSFAIAGRTPASATSARFLAQRDAESSPISDGSGPWSKLPTGTASRGLWTGRPRPSLLTDMWEWIAADASRRDRHLLAIAEDRPECSTRWRLGYERVRAEKVGGSTGSVSEG